jgi:2-hydroxycyclohexanecarboxyl-CoA dehydrogenase
VEWKLSQETVIALEVNVTDTASVEAGVRAVTRVLGPVEIVVNNAGWDDFMPFIATSEEFWDKILDLNFKGALRVTKAVLPGMIERRFGRIVNIGSDAGRVGSSLEAVYSGSTDTPALRKLVDGAGQDAEKVISGMVRAVPMKRLGTPEDIGPAVAFFASDAAAFITGQTLSVSGGLTMA